MQVNKINISYILGSRMDISFYQKRFDYVSNIFPLYSLSQLLYVNPSVNFNKLSPDENISFVPMETIDEIYGIIREKRVTKVSNAKGFTKFTDNDLLWSKITPCMQNGKSAIARNLINGYGCGSTEFYVLRPKENNVLIEYVHYLLRDKRVLESAKNSFGGSAGQQRVSISYLKSIKIPLPPLDVQKEIVTLYNKALNDQIEKNNQASKILESIDGYLFSQLGVTYEPNSKHQREFKVNFSDIIGRRYSVSNYLSSINNIYKALSKSNYKLKQLSTVSKFQSGFAFKSKDYVQNSACKLITIKNISKNSINVTNVIYLPSDYYKTYQKFVISKNSILIAITGATIGKLGIYSSDEAALLNQRVGMFLPNGIDPLYLMNILNTEIYQIIISNKAGGGAQPNISESEIMSIEIPLPPIEKQNEIANGITNIRLKAQTLQQEGNSVLNAVKNRIDEIILKGK